MRMRGVILAMAVMAAAVAIPPTSAMADKAERAQALVDEAIAHYKEVGKQKAIADFNDKSSRFVTDAFYVIVANSDEGNGTFKAHAINPALIDNPKLWDLKDVNGKYIIRAMVRAGKANPDGSWVEYVWTHPETKKLAQKRTWVEKHDDLLFMVGFYEDDG